MRRTRADNNIEQNITSSDIDFLEGDDISDAKKDKTEKHVSVGKTRTTLDLSGLECKDDSDVDMLDSDIMSVLDQIIDKELTLSHTVQRSLAQTCNNAAVKQKNAGQSQSLARYVET